MKRAAVYAILDRFAARELVEGRPEPGGSHPDRQVYHLTTEGEAALSRFARALERTPDLPAAALVALIMAHEAGLCTFDPGDAIRVRNATLATLRGDPHHGQSRAYRLARWPIEAELEVLRDPARRSG